MPSSAINRQVGLVSYVEPGCRVWSTERMRATSVDEIPVGGLVVAVTEQADVDTGEIDRAFLCFDDVTSRPRLHWSTLREAEVDRQLIEALDHPAITRAWRRLAEHIAFTAPHKPRRGVATAEEVRAAQAIVRLQEVVFGPAGALHGVLTPDKRAVPVERPYHPPLPGSAFVD